MKKILLSILPFIVILTAIAIFMVVLSHKIIPNEADAQCVALHPQGGGCYWTDPRIFHRFDGTNPQVTCAPGEYVAGLEVDEPGPADEGHRLYCCPS